MKDTELFIDENFRKSIQEKLLARFLELYKEIFNEISHFLEKNKIELNSEKKITKETLNQIFENNPFHDSLQIFNIEEMSNLFSQIKQN